MTDVADLLHEFKSVDPLTTILLLPQVYDELRKLADGLLRSEAAAQSWQATCLVHEAFLRLVLANENQTWDSRAHFFSAAAETIRRILIEAARRRSSQKRGGGWRRLNVDAADLMVSIEPEEILLVDETIGELINSDPVAGELVRLRYYSGLTIEQASTVLGISPATAYRNWAFARAWLASRLNSRGES